MRNESRYAGSPIPEVMILPIENTTSKKKKNVFNDGVKNAEDNENIGERLNMPLGSRRPQDTAK